MRLLTYLFILVSAIILTSCLTIEEKIILNKDGSGSFLISMDMSELLADPMMGGMILKSMEKDNAISPATMKMDSVIDLYSDLVDLNPQWTAADRTLLQRLDSRLKMDLEEKKGGYFMRFDFAELGEITQLQNLMSSANSGKEKGDKSTDAVLSSMMGSDGLLAEVINKFSFKKRSFSRTATSTDEALDGLGLGEMPVDGQDDEMLKSMLGGFTIAYVMEFPGNIKKVNGFPNHTIENGNQIVQRFSFLELFEEEFVVGDLLTGSVKFKNK